MRVLITGGGTGIGLGIARTLVARGDEVVLVGRRQSVIREAAEAVGGAWVAGDVTGDLSALLDAAGPVDGLVNNAGSYLRSPVEELDADTLDAMWAVHARAPALLTRAFAARTERGAVVNISSTLAKVPVPGAAAYSAAKAAMSSLTRTLALELAPRIRVNAVLPGVVPTAMTDRGSSFLDEVAKLHPLGLGTPEDVGEAVAYLLHARWVTGTELVVDGGLTAGSGG